jgi:hypothetical protein
VTQATEPVADTSPAEAETLKRAENQYFEAVKRMTQATEPVADTSPAEAETSPPTQ